MAIEIIERGRGRRDEERVGRGYGEEEVEAEVEENSKRKQNKDEKASRNRSNAHRRRNVSWPGGKWVFRRRQNPIYDGAFDKAIFIGRLKYRYYL